MRKKAKSKAKATRAPKHGQLARTRQLVLDTTTVPAVKRSFTATQTVNPLPVVLPPLPCCQPD